MKKLLQIAVLLTVVAWGAFADSLRAQGTLTVGDNSTTSAYCPVYGLQMDKYQRCHFVFPAEALYEMNGSAISQLTFYLSSPASQSWGEALFQVALAEISDISLYSFYPTSMVTVVYEGPVSGTGSTMEVVFDSEYTYHGGNLLVAFETILPGSYSSATFSGSYVAGEAPMVMGYSSDPNNITSDQGYFLPTTTFTYGEATEEPCETVVVTDNAPFLEGFEYGTDFGCWEVIAENDEMSWSPNTCSTYSPIEGSGYAAFYGDYGHGELAYLISPVLDITAVTEPVLSFAHAQEDWAGDQNTLTVYYRTSETEEWTILIPENDNSIPTWIYDTVALPNPSATYQIAFMGKALYGEPVVIDDLFVGHILPAPEPCDAPANVTAVAEATTAVISWESDAESWNIRVNGGTPISVSTHPYTLTALTPSTSYTVEVQAVCAEDNLSDWSDAATFTTTVGIAQCEGISTAIFPNPATTELNVRLSANISGEIAICDVYGKMLRKEAINGQNATISVSDMADGVYFLRISDGNAVVANTKFVKK